MSDKNSRYRWVVLLISCLAIFAPSYAQYQLSPLAPKIINELGLTTNQFSSVFTAPMIPAIFLSLLAGLLADRIGIKCVIAVGMAVTAIGSIYRISSNSYTTLFFGMFLIGFGAAFLNANIMKVVGSWFAADKVGSMMGIFLAASTLSMSIGMGTTALLPSIKVAYIISAALSVAASILWILLMKSPIISDKEQASPLIPIKDCLKKVLKVPGIWLVGICLMSILGCNVIVSTFLPTALGERGIDIVSAGAYSSVVMIGNLIGCMFVPILSTKIGKEKPLITVLSLISMLGVIFGWRAPQGGALAVSLFITGISMGGLMPILMSMPIRFPEIGSVYAGTAGGVTSTLQLLGAVVIPTYIVSPIAGSNMNVFFIAGGICMAMVFLLGLWLPENLR